MYLPFDEYCRKHYDKIMDLFSQCERLMGLIEVDKEGHVYNPAEDEYKAAERAYAQYAETYFPADKGFMYYDIGEEDKHYIDWVQTGTSKELQANEKVTMLLQVFHYRGVMFYKRTEISKLDTFAAYFDLIIKEPEAPRSGEKET
jgi:hypothetical protein